MVTAGQRVRVRVVSVDPVTNKIALTMRSKEDVQAAQEAREQPREAREPAGEGAAARSGRERLGKIATRGAATGSWSAAHRQFQVQLRYNSRLKGHFTAKLSTCAEKAGCWSDQLTCIVIGADFSHAHRM